MKIHPDNLVHSSAYLWLDNLVGRTAEGYQNTSSRFYQTDSNINGLYAYGAPFKQFVSDSSVSGAQIPTGVYVGGSFIPKGTSGLIDINYKDGEVYFSSPVNQTISGYYAVKDFNIYLTDEAEEKIIFETKYNIRPKIQRNSASGALKADIVAPCIFIKDEESNNEPMFFGGVEWVKYKYSLYIFSDNKYNINALEGYLKDSVRNYFPLISKNESPYNNLGGFNSGYFNYTGFYASKTPGGSQSVYIEDVRKVSLANRLYSEISNVNPNLHFSMVTIDLCLEKTPS